MSKTLKPYYYLDGVINVLLVDSNPAVLKSLFEILKPLRLYSVDTASSAHEAERKLRTPRRTHIVVMDLGLNDIKNDEFYLLKKYSNRISFVIFSGCHSSARGFAAGQFGAKVFFEKTTNFDNANFISSINKIALFTVINPRYKFESDTLSRSTDILFNKSPKFVSQWAQLLGLTDRALRLIWTKNLGANAKIIISTYHIFKTAFDYYSDIINEKVTSDHANVTSERYIYLEEFFHTHKSTISDLIAYGDIAAFMAN